jgi:hypothetical protein
MNQSPFGEVAVLPEREARTITSKIVACLRSLNARPTRFGIHLDKEGFWFVADINGKTVSARTGQGNFTYEQVARELVLASVHPEWDKITVAKS